MSICSEDRMSACSDRCKQIANWPAQCCSSLINCVCSVKTWIVQDMNPWRMSTPEVGFAFVCIFAAICVNVYLLQNNVQRYHDSYTNPSSSVSYVTLQSIPPLVFQVCGGPFNWVTYQYNRSSTTPGMTPDTDLNQYCIQIVQSPEQNFELPVKGPNDTVPNNRIILIQGQLPSPFKTLFLTVAVNSDPLNVPILPKPDGASARVSTLGLNSDELNVLIGLSLTTFRDINGTVSYETQLSKEVNAPTTTGQFLLIMTTKDVNFNGLQVTQSLTYSIGDILQATWVNLSISTTVFVFLFPRIAVVRMVRVFRWGKHSNPHVDPSLEFGPEDHARESPIKHTSATITKSQSTQPSITDIDLDTVEPGRSIQSRTTNTQHSSSSHKSGGW